MPCMVFSNRSFVLCGLLWVGHPLIGVIPVRSADALSDWDLGEFGGFDNAHIVDFLKPFLIKYISVQGCNVLLGGREQNPGCPSRTFHYNETVNSICDSCQGF